jgi:DNA-binding XRE family transcriptional regulator
VLGLATVPYPAYAAPESGSDTVQGLYDALLSTMKNGRTLGQSGRFTQLDPVIRRTFDIRSMARLAVGSSWGTLSEAQHQQVTESFGRFISAIYANRFDSSNLRRLRHAKGISQEDLAYEAGVNRTYVSKLEKGTSYPGLEIIAKLATVLEVEPAELIKLPAPQPMRSV